MSSPDTAALRHDEQARARIGPWTPDGVPDLSDFDAHTNFVVRAAAGSGKTTSLVGRMVALVRTGDARVRDLTAITFTRKAAGEMSKRFFEDLQDARDAVPPDSDEGQRLAHALRNVQHAFIGTVHAFCSRMLREHALSAGLPPDFAVGLDDDEEAALRQRAWHAHLAAVRRDDPDALDALYDLGVSPTDLGDTFDVLCTYPDLDPYTHAPPSLPDLETPLEAAFALLDTWLPRIPSDAKPDGVMKALRKADRMRRYLPLDTPAQRADVLDVLAGALRSESKAKVTLSRWGSRGSDAYAAAKELRDDRFPHLVTHTLRPALRAFKACVHERIMALVCPAVDRYRRLRADEGQLTHHDLLAFARDLLKNDPSVRKQVQERHPRLLVDEFQDTDPLQAELLFYLASTDPAETDWQQCTPRPGSLFIVGDDKQSIYRFRRADKDVFDTVVAHVEAHGGEALDLTRNFRSLGALCAWCNDAFDALFAEPELADLQADYVDFLPHRPDGADPHAIRRLPVPDVAYNRGDAIAQHNAGEIARTIRLAVERGGASDTLNLPPDTFDGAPQYSDFLILTRTKSRLAHYAEALAAHGIPYTITGSEDLGDAPALRALVDLLAAARRPDDPVAAVAYLRGALVGLSDDALYALKRAGVDFGALPDGDAALEEWDAPALDAALAGRFRNAVARLHATRTHLQNRRPAFALASVLEDSGLFAAAAHPPDPAQASLDAGRMLRLATHIRHRAADGDTWTDIADDLQDLLDGERTEDGMTLDTGQSQAVRVMNVHQAKGLQAPVVFLADPYGSGGSGHTPTRHVRRDTGELVAPAVRQWTHNTSITHAPLGWHADSDAAFVTEEARHATAEAHRLLYVAATRAKNLLVVSTYPKKRRSGPWGPLADPLDHADVPELTVPDALPDALQSTTSDVLAPNLDAHRQRRAAALDAVSPPSFHETTVTQRAHGLDADADAVGDASGFGKGFGRALHALFEEAVRHRHTPDALTRDHVRAFLTMDGDAPSDARAVRHAEALLHALHESDFWPDVCAADRAFTEYPFAVSLADAPETLVLRGTIDLVYRTPTGWHLVDYKTDRLTTSPEALDRFDAYAEQVRQYAAAWNAHADAPIARALLWFADGNRCVVVTDAPA